MNPINKRTLYHVPKETPCSGVRKMLLLVLILECQIILADNTKYIPNNWKVICIRTTELSYTKAYETRLNLGPTIQVTISIAILLIYGLDIAMSGFSCRSFLGQGPNNWVRRSFQRWNHFHLLTNGLKHSFDWHTQFGNRKWIKVLRIIFLITIFEPCPEPAQEIKGVVECVWDTFDVQVSCGFPQENQRKKREKNLRCI